MSPLVRKPNIVFIAQYATLRAQPNTRLRGRDTDRVINSRPRNLRFSA
jgi:hypothetical protein